MNHQEYNGWWNYETWVVSLWMDNDPSSYGYWRTATEEVWGESEPDAHFTRKERARLTLADRLKDEHEELLPEVEGFASDLLGAAMSEVNWHEIAENLLEEYKDGPEDEEDGEAEVAAE